MFGKVIRTAVFNPTVYSHKEFAKTDIASPSELTQQIVANPELESWILGNSPVTSDEVRQKITHLIETEKPDVILFEQPFLYLGMQQLLQELESTTPLIYSSHNVESHMMQEIFASQSLDQKYASELAQLQKSEGSLTQSAIGIISVSKEDEEVFLKCGGKNIIVQGNGVNPLKTSKLKRLRVRRVMKKLGISSYALFVGSSHRPNIDGFIELIGTRLGYLPPDSMIFLAGDIARGLQPEVEKIDPVWGSLMWARLYNWDRVSEKTLSALYTEASCVLLPISGGGGSNIKTAEALSSNKKVIGTKSSLRGYKFEGHNFDIWVVDSNDDFRNQLPNAFFSKNSKSLERKPNYLWEYQLGGVSKWINELDLKI